jgi:hypothetical protein
MTEVLGRLVASDLESPRGPDASHRLRVPHAFLERGATVEFELPRHLTCAACDGGGCDPCERSGAVTLRGRGEPQELLELSLPKGDREDAFMIRVPERGGLPPAGSNLPRGHLLLRVEPCEESQASQSLRRTKPSLKPRPTLPSLRVVVSSRSPLTLLLLAGLALAILATIWILSKQ